MSLRRNAAAIGANLDGASLELDATKNSRGRTTPNGRLDARSIVSALTA
jgi:hypothetical protein